ncbi:hypothetical protein MUP38_00460 [Candidatus Bathyarchaeota archaeon]|nr:hypothetical protein [Candidatus Bathyarchaeota archaeon]
MTSKIKRLIAAGLLLVFLSFTMVESTRALALTPGVVPGADFLYNVTAFWSSTDEYTSIPPELVDINQTETFEVRVHNVTEANVTTFVAVYYRNGTYDSEYGLVDVDTGAYYGAFAAIIAGNLNAHEVIHPLGIDGITINETVVKAYESGNRDTNRIIIETRNATTGVTGSVDRYFDKASGILVESYEKTTSADLKTTTTVTWKLKETNGWTVPEFPSALILPLLMAITMIAAIAYKKKHAGIAKPLISS